MSMLDPLNPLLWRACLVGDVTLMENIMSKGADAHVKDRNGETCLHMTARSGEVDAIERMVDEGLDLDMANHNGQTPLHVAVNKDHMGIVRYIIRHGGRPDLTTKFSGMTGLHLACRDNNEHVVKFLLDNGANCAIKDKIQNYADFYTSSKTILETFDEHFVVCTHGRRKGLQEVHKPPTYLLEGMETETDLSTLYKRPSVDTSGTYRTHSRNQAQTVSISRDASGTAMINDDEEVEKARSKVATETTDRERQIHHRDDRGRAKPTYGELEHGEVTIYDKMENYDVDRDKQNWDLSKRDGRKIKLNHTMGFSEEHKRRMQQNVFDRLLGSKKKKADDKR